MTNDPAEALRDSARRLEEVKRREAATRNLVDALRGIRERNHFAERIAESMRPPPHQEYPR